MKIMFIVLKSVLKILLELLITLTKISLLKYILIHITFSVNEYKQVTSNFLM